MKKEIESIQVTKPFLPPYNEYIDKIKTIWDTNWLTNNGPLHRELEEKIAQYLKAPNSTLFTNGHLALDIAIKALGLTGEVITTPFTFASTTHAIVANGLTPVFCDVKMDDFTIDTDKIEELITDKTSAIIPVHVFGYPCNVKAIDKIAKKYNLKTIYDAAHVFGVEIDGVGIGNFGDISMFSLHATKVYNSIEGGVLTYKNEGLTSRLNMYKNFGIASQEEVEVIGLNAKMSEFQAAMGLVNLKYINGEIEKRKKVVEAYRHRLREVKGISFMEDKKNINHNYAYFPIIVHEKVTGIHRDELYIKLKEYNIFTRKYFYPLTTDFQCYKGKYKDSDLINARYLSERVLTLPIYGDLKEKHVNIIVDAIKEIIQLSK